VGNCLLLLLLLQQQLLLLLLLLLLLHGGGGGHGQPPRPRHGARPPHGWPAAWRGADGGPARRRHPIGSPPHRSTWCPGGAGALRSRPSVKQRAAGGGGGGGRATKRRLLSRSVVRVLVVYTVCVHVYLDFDHAESKSPLNDLSVRLICKGIIEASCFNVEAYDVHQLRSQVAG
jgi:hypothetical protein